MLPEHLQGTRIGLLGFGANHQALLGWLIRHGAEDVVVYDEAADAESRVRSAGFADAQVVAGPGALERIDAPPPHRRAGVLFRTPGIPLHRPELQAAKARGAVLTSQTELFLALCPARTIGVTGTKGKGTVSSLIAHILESRVTSHESRGRVYLAGNIGTDPFEFLDELTKDDIVVLELSSFQLDGIQVSPRVAVVLGISADHLDHHASLLAYRDAKANLVRYQGPGDVAVLNLDSETSLGLAEAAGGTVLYYSTRKSIDAGCYLQDGTYYWRDPRRSETEAVATVEELGIQAPHNQENAAAAIAVGKLLGVRNATIVHGIRSFKGLPHRLELVAEVDGVRWINDSYATVPDATIAALRSFGEAPLHLIVGGYDKGLDWYELGQAIAARAPKQLLVIGQTGPAIARAAIEAGYGEKQVKVVERLERAIEWARRMAEAGDVILLSPASASFDQFRNVTERGEAFRSLVGSVARVGK